MKGDAWLNAPDGPGFVVAVPPAWSLILIHSALPLPPACPTQKSPAAAG
jgi:hypothetical protein